METKHTQGEWSILGKTLIKCNGEQVASVNSILDEYEANAKLIANAPLMLEALLKIQSRTDLFPFINEVIQKATN